MPTQAVLCLPGVCPCSLAKTSFSVMFSMKVQQSNGVWAVPPLALTLVSSQLLAVAIIGGVNGYVTISQSPHMDGAGVISYGITIKFPLRIYGQQYPATCPNSTQNIVDVSYIEASCPDFANNLWGQLQSGLPLYNRINNSLTAFLGVPLAVLEFTVPRCY